MKISNIHSRRLPIPLERAGLLIDSLGSKEDKLWPKATWPAMRFDRPLSVGAAGGHGPIRYYVNRYEPGRSACFTFTAPKGFIGTHTFELMEMDSITCKLTHSIEMRATGSASLKWLIMIRPMHDALIEDSLFLAEQFAGAANPTKLQWTLWVKTLRHLLKKR